MSYDRRRIRGHHPKACTCVQCQEIKSRPPRQRRPIWAGDPDPGAKRNTSGKPDSVPLEPETEPQPEPEPGPEPEPQLEPKPEPEPEPQLEPEPETIGESKTQLQAESESLPELDTEPNQQFESRPEQEPEAMPGLESKSEQEPEAGPKFESRPEQEPRAMLGPEPEHEPELEPPTGLMGGREVQRVANAPAGQRPLSGPERSRQDREQRRLADRLRTTSVYSTPKRQPEAHSRSASRRRRAQDDDGPSPWGIIKTLVVVGFLIFLISSVLWDLGPPDSGSSESARVEESGGWFSLDCDSERRRRRGGWIRGLVC